MASVVLEILSETLILQKMLQKNEKCLTVGGRIYGPLKWVYVVVI